MEAKNIRGKSDFIFSVTSMPLPFIPFTFFIVLFVAKKIITIFRTDLLNYEVRGLKVGTSVITASARSSTGKIIKSAPHQIQVFEPLSLEPRVVTLIPESVFQVCEKFKILSTYKLEFLCKIKFSFKFRFLSSKFN